MIPRTPKDLIISNPGQGKEISFAPNLKEQAQLLRRAEKQGAYYPVLAMKHLKALSVGLAGKNNVFIPNINDFKSNTFQKVVVFVPGIRATVERRANDTLVITELWLDPNESYMAIQRGSLQKPGVYEVSRERQDINIKYKNNGRILARDERRVVVADTKYSDPQKAATAAVASLEDIFGRDAALMGAFDLFYSPIGSKLGNMRNYNPLVFNQAHAFAGLLADAIEQSIKQKRVIWASELSGSVVLTQSLQALAHKNLSFKEQSHIVKMHLPTTDPATTLAAANHLGMLADKDMAKGNGNIRASFSSLVINANRARDKSDHYTWQDYAQDLSNGGAGALGAVGAISLGASVAVSSPVLATAGTVASAAGAIQLTFNAIKKRLKKGF